MNRDRALFKHFSLNPDHLYWGSEHENYSRRIRDAVESRRLIGVIGPFGSGKSVLVQESINSVKGLDTIYIDNSDRERLRIGNITQLMVLSLSNEDPRRDNTARQLQLSRILGETVMLSGREVVIVIENAHRLHANTLLAIKDLRESVRYKGRAFLFSVILVGQQGLRTMLEKYGEVQYRTRPIELDKNGWMDVNERISYLEAVYGDVIEPKTRERLALMFDSPLRLDHYIEGLLLDMRDAGIATLDEAVMPMTLAEKRDLIKDVSLRDIARQAGVPKSTVHDVIQDRNDDPETRVAVDAALDRLIAASHGPSLRRVGA